MACRNQRDQCCDHSAPMTDQSPSLAVRSGGRTVLGQVSLVTLALAAIVMLLAPQQTRPGTFVWNFTPSVPVGLYHIDAPAWKKGDRVAVRLSGRAAGILLHAGVLEPGRLLLKRVAAADSDIVCREGETIRINGAPVAHAKSVDSRGAQLPTWSGCEQLGVRQVLLLGEMPDSFDGRYFGPTDVGDIMGRISSVILLPTQGS